VTITKAGELSCSIEDCKLKCLLISQCEGTAFLSGTAEKVEIVASSLSFESQATLQHLVLRDCTDVVACPAVSASRVEIVDCADVALGQLATSALDIRKSRVTIAAALEVSDALIAYDDGRKVMSWVDSQIEVGAFASVRPLSIPLLRSRALMHKCRLAGIQIEPGGESFIHHSQSEGVLFVSSRDGRSSVPVRHEGGLIIIERSILTGDTDVAMRALDRADAIMGSWIGSWTQAVRSGLERRRAESAGEPKSRLLIPPR
jgi:hypothetical protein